MELRRRRATALPQITSRSCSRALEQAKCNVFRLHLEPAWTNDNSYTFQGATGQASSASGEADIRKFNPARLTTYLKSLYFPLMQKAMKHGMYVVVRPPGVCPNPIKVGDYYQQYLMQVWDLFTQNDSIRKYSGQISIELANEPVSVKDASGNDDKKACTTTSSLLSTRFVPTASRASSGCPARAGSPAMPTIRPIPSRATTLAMPSTTTTAGTAVPTRTLTQATSNRQEEQDQPVPQPGARGRHQPHHHHRD